jgi:hypothetical protein
MKAMLRPASIVVLLVGSACVSRIRIEGAPCPCPAGYSCLGGQCVGAGTNNVCAVGAECSVRDGNAPVDAVDEADHPIGVSATTGPTTGTDALDTAPDAADTGGSDGGLCGRYCDLIMWNCSGPNAQYEDKAGCMTACNYFPAGVASDTSQNTIWCRLNSALKANLDPNPIRAECWSAGPLGYYTCGPECESFCWVATSYCSAANGYRGEAFASLSACTAYCEQLYNTVDFGQPGAYSAQFVPGVSAETTDNLGCRSYELFVKALKSAGDRDAYCPNVAPSSPVCVPPPLPDAGSVGEVGLL